MYNPNTESGSTRIAIGSLIVVSIFLIACSYQNIFPFIEGLSNTGTWGLLVSIPVLIISYILGTLAICITDFFIDKTVWRLLSMPGKYELLFRVAQLDNSLISNKYSKLVGRISLLQISVPTILLLSVSVLKASSLLITYRLTVKYLAILVLVLIPLIIVVLVYLYLDLKKFQAMLIDRPGIARPGAVKTPQINSVKSLHLELKK
ncbi:hypothetical protein KAR48_19050 [bacterium]|nr:hypothetical protein [bacterium]